MKVSRTRDEISPEGKAEHYGTFPVLVQTTEEDFSRWAEQYAPATAVFELTPGEPIEMPPRSG